MTLKGDLQGVSLATLIQLICQEGKRGALYLSHGRERGVIYFDGGEVVHALAGALVGEQAFYRMLGWTQGAFRMGNHVDIPQQTITVPWSHLLLEGLRLVDEERQEAQQDQSRPLNRAEIVQDEVFENELILLLSNLEYARSQVAGRKNRKRPASVLQTLAEMANEVIAFTDRYLPDTVSDNSLATALDHAGEIYPRARLLQAEGDRLSPQTMASLYNSWKGNATGRRHTFGQVALGIVDVLEMHFSLFIDHFNASSTADQWGETCGVFIKELKQAVSKVTF